MIIFFNKGIDVINIYWWANTTIRVEDIQPPESWTRDTFLTSGLADGVTAYNDWNRKFLVGGYYLRCYFKTNSPNPPRPQLRFIVFKENGKIVNRFKVKAKLNEDWERTTISAGFIKPGARFGRLGIYIPPFKEGSIWIDDTGCFEVHGFKID